jgi:putative protease
VEAGLIPIASLRLNVTGRASADVIGEMGARHVILSPELKAAAIRDVARRSAISCGAVVYGKLPLMLLRRCLMADYACSGNCGGAGCILPHTMSDRRGADLTLLPIGDRMNLIVNPHPIWSADRQSETSSLGISHFIFADEIASVANSVIRAYKAGLAPDAAGAGQIKRL